MTEKFSASGGDQTWDHQINRPELNLLSYRGSRFIRKMTKVGQWVK